MKKIIFPIALISLLFSCKKEDTLRYDYEKNCAQILSIEKTAGSFSFGYTMKGEGQLFQDPNTGQNYIQYQVASLFSNTSYEVGRNLSRQPISRADSLFNIKCVKENI